VRRCVLPSPLPSTPSPCPGLNPPAWPSISCAPWPRLTTTAVLASGAPRAQVAAASTPPASPGTTAAAAAATIAGGVSAAVPLPGCSVSAAEAEGTAAGGVGSSHLKAAGLQGEEHAACTVVSLLAPKRRPDSAALLAGINAELARAEHRQQQADPCADDGSCGRGRYRLRVVAAGGAGTGFDAEKRCDKLIYEVMVPLHLLLPPDGQPGLDAVRSRVLVICCSVGRE
jgi:hypothetical protein